MVEIGRAFELEDTNKKERHKQNDDARGEDEAELFADDGKDKISVCFRKKRHLLAPRAEAYAVQTASTERENALPQLVGAVTTVALDIKKEVMRWRRTGS